MKSRPKVATITLSWNQKDDLRDILNCIKKQSLKPAETIVVDNGSEDGSQEMVRREFLWIRFISLGENTGYAKGYNICFSAVSKNIDYVVVLDQDILVPENYIEKVVRRFESEPSHTAVLMCDLEEPRIKTFALKEGYTKVFHGSCWSYRNKHRNLIKFEEPFFVYSNEADLSARLLKRGKHDFRYAMRSKKTKKLGWKPFHSFDSALKKTIDWYKENQAWWKKRLS